VGASETTPLGEWKGVCTVLEMLRDGYKVNAVFLSFILSTTLFQITDTFRFFWDSACFGIPRSAQTYGLGPEMHILTPNCRSGMTHPSADIFSWVV